MAKMRVEQAKEIFAFCFTCDMVLAEVDAKALNDPEKYAISRRVVYESAERHRELAPGHNVVVYDQAEMLKRRPS